MEDYEKFDQLIENLGSSESEIDAEFDSFMQIVEGLKDNQPQPSAAARMRSQRLMLEESKTIRESSKAQRMSFIGSLYGWAVPAILMLAIVGVVFGNSSIGGVEEPSTIQSGSGVLATAVPTEVQAEPEQIEDPAGSADVEIVPELTVTITATVSLTRNVPIEDGPAAEPIPDELVPYPSPDSESESRSSEADAQPAGDRGEIPSPPERPLPGSNIEPPEGSDAELIVTPRPGDGREGGRNPDS